MGLFGSSSSRKSYQYNSSYSIISVPESRHKRPLHQTRWDDIYMELRGYTQHYDHQDSWHRLRGSQRTWIIEVEELGGSYVPEDKLGRCL